MQPLTIIELRAQNVKRLKAVTITPDGSLVIVGGSNGQGKSSCLDSIMYALAGKGSLPPKPVREGEEEATIRLDLGEYVVTRTIAPDRSSTIKVIGKDGGRMSSPQDILDGLVGNLSFDPLAFSRMDSTKQVNELKRLVGLDFDALDRQRATKTEERLLVGREVTSLKGQLQGMPRHIGAPTTEVSIKDLSAELSRARGVNQQNAKHRHGLEESKAAVAQWANRITELDTELAEARSQHAKWQADVANTPPSPLDVDEEAIVRRLGTVESDNRKVRENSDRLRISQQLDQKEAAYKTLTDEIQSIDKQKTHALASAKFPVPTLSFDDAGVLVDGVPFQQASAAERLRVSVAMGLALNPRLKVILVRDGSLLDAKSMSILREMAADAGAQVWIERVSTGEECAVVIEDGEVVG